MSNTYTFISWNPFKKSYDKIMLLGIGLIVISFVGLQLTFDSQITLETLIIRTTSLTAIFLLHFILIIGPLCRLNKSFLPLLYNRRHLGVTMFLFAAIHSIFSIIQFHALGDINPLASVFLSNIKYLSISQFPFQVFGFLAFIIFFLMAATSHDFWLNKLSPKIWKSLHMLVYLAYTLVILHVALGILQYENKLIYWILLIASFGTVAGFHLVAGLKERKWLQVQKKYVLDNGYYEVCNVSEIPEDCAKTLFLEGQNIAIFKYDNKLSAVNNICRHQMGPLGEGKIIDGCITCPWHGYQYLPENGQSPPPFTEKLETYHLKLIKGVVWIDPKPNAEGTFVEPVKLSR